MKLERLIRGYDRVSERVVCEFPLATVPLERLVAVYSSTGDPLMYDCYPVTAESERLLREYNDFPRLENDTVDYFLECQAANL